MKPTTKDAARRAGIGFGTVSRVQYQASYFDNQTVMGFRSGVTGRTFTGGEPEATIDSKTLPPPPLRHVALPAKGRAVVRPISFYRYLEMIPFLFALPLAALDFENGERTPAILVDPAEPAFVRIAANDLVSDVRRITGRTMPIVISPAACGHGCIALASATVPASRAIIQSIAPDLNTDLIGKHEMARLKLVRGGAAEILLIAGSDERGTMFGLYDFIEHSLGVDPMYLWSGLSPSRRSNLRIDSLDRTIPEPSFRFRGWFLNDEDLLTEWKRGGGPRNIDYPFYSQVTAPEVMEMVFETMLRLRFNLVIPASFTDIENPAEARMIEAATRRGLHVSMHHVEPMGVSAFAFANYWQARGKKVEYSYSSNPEAFHEVWRHYARRWAKYPGVVWQVGLRGIADRPVWVADKTAPTSDEGRGAMISRAMAEQVKLIREVDRRPDEPITTTLWMEGSYLFSGGHLKIPRDVTIVFADNNSGWKWQGDFHDTPREMGRTYGVYYHHAVWGMGPHLVQAASPALTFNLLKQAWRRNGGAYAIFNVANVREFALGLAATAEMTRDLDRFNPDAFLAHWLTGRFGDQAEAAGAAYRAFFDSYVVHEKRGTPDLLDGLALHEGERILSALNAGKLPQPARGAEFDGFARSFQSVRTVGEEDPTALLVRLDRQIANLDRTIAAADGVRPAGQAKDFFDANLRGQAHILRGICRWTAELARAAIAKQQERNNEFRNHVDLSLTAFEEIRAGQAMNTRGEWRDWYRGETKMNLGRAEARTRQLKDKR